MTINPLTVFVYGTLKPGYANHNRYCRDRLLKIQPAQVQGALFDLPLGYPGMAKGEQWVQGFILTLKEDGTTLSDLDALEDYDPNNPNSLYTREITEVFSPTGDSLGQVWVYYMAIAHIQSMQGTPVLSGNWQGQLSA